MRHNVSILLGEDMKKYASRLAKYIYKYGEGKAEEFCRIQSWIKLSDGRIESKKAELDSTSANGFESTTRTLYSTRLVEDTILDAENQDLQLRHYFTKLHQHIITVNNGGDSNRLLLTIYLPLYDRVLYNQVAEIVDALNGIQSHYSVMVIALCSDLRTIIHPDDATSKTTPEAEAELRAAQKENLDRLAELRLAANNLEQVVVLQNINAAGYALNLEEDSFIRIMGELSLLTVEKYDTVFTQATEFDREHPLCTLGLSVLNLDKYYFSNYLLRRAYLRILDREDVAAEKVDLNKVAVVAHNLLQQHRLLFSDFYSKSIEPLVRQHVPQDTIVSQTSQKLQHELDGVTAHLSDFITKGEFTLPEKRALLAVILGYDDQLLHGNLFNQDQHSLDILDEEVANLFISANNDLVSKNIDENGNEIIIKGPLTDCCDEHGRVELPIKRLLQLRNDMRESTNYIRQKSEELKEIEKMTDNAIESEKLLTEDGFVIEGNIYHFDIDHQEVKFDERYQAKRVTEKSVDLRAGFTPIKDQGEIGACTVFAVSSIFEYILKKNSHQNHDLSESFVYYNVRHAEGNEKEDTGSSYQDVIGSIGSLGICTEALHPYSKGLSEQPSEDAYQDAIARRITKALDVAVKEEDIKSAIQEGYPVAVSLKVYNSFSATTNSGNGSHVGASGFVQYPSKEEIESDEYGYHAMVIVGYTDETKHFVVRNSWGQSFGDKGYCYIPYSYICDTELNRMACIITEVDTSATGESIHTIVGGRGGESTIVQFNMNDAFIKKHVIKNLIDSEQRHLAVMEKEDLMLRRSYEMMMQNLGRQTIRKEILARKQEQLQQKIEAARAEQKRINEIERPSRLKSFDQLTWSRRLTLIGWDVSFLLIWIGCITFYLRYKGYEGLSVLERLGAWFKSDLCIWLTALFAIGVILTILYWWWIRSQRRKIEMSLEELSAAQANIVQTLSEELETSQLKFHIAGMVVDGLLSLKMTLDQKYQAMKSFIGNLTQWQKEEKEASAVMEPLVRHPFIPLLKNDILDRYFDDNAEDITGEIHLYEYFNSYKLDEEAIIAYKHQLKENILRHITTQLSDFTIFRHVFKTRDYPYLDKEYASAQNLLPLLDRKSEPFCQLRSNAITKPQARFLFIRTDAEEKRAWMQEYPRYFNTTPISDDIQSIYKVLALRLQPLAANEILMEDSI